MKSEIMFMIDEAAHIGQISVLEDAVTLMRAYGVRIWFFFQSYNQLRTCYGDKADTIYDNMSVKQFFGINSFESSEVISKQIGDCTIFVESLNRNRSRSVALTQGKEPQPGNYTSGDGVTINEAGRRLIRPEEILLLSEDVSLTFVRNLPVIPTRLVPYFKDPEFKKGGVGRKPGVGIAGVLLSVLALTLAYVLCLFMPVVLKPPFVRQNTPYYPRPSPGVKAFSEFPDYMPVEDPDRYLRFTEPPASYGGGQERSVNRQYFRRQPRWHLQRNSE